MFLAVATLQHQNIPNRNKNQHPANFHYNSLLPVYSTIRLCGIQQNPRFRKLPHPAWTISSVKCLRRICVYSSPYRRNWNSNTVVDIQISFSRITCSLRLDGNVYNLHLHNPELQFIHSLFLWWHTRKNGLDGTPGFQHNFHGTCRSRWDASGLLASGKPCCSHGGKKSRGLSRCRNLASATGGCNTT